MHLTTNKNEIASANTVNNLIRVARLHFSQYGYEKTSLESISKEVKMTRGALYHHFKNKKMLFLAVLTEVQIEVGSYVEKKAMSSDDEWEQLVLGCIAFVEAAVKESNRRIFLIDSISVVGWGVWRDMDSKNSATHLEEQLQVLKDLGILVNFNTSYITHLISGALNELSLYLAESNEMSKEELRSSVEYLLIGFKADGN